jgi:hypothetical protein
MATYSFSFSSIIIVSYQISYRQVVFLRHMYLFMYKLSQHHGGHRKLGDQAGACVCLVTSNNFISIDIARTKNMEVISTTVLISLWCCESLPIQRCLDEWCFHF